MIDYSKDGANNRGQAEVRYTHEADHQQSETNLEWMKKDDIVDKIVFWSLWIKSKNEYNENPSLNIKHIINEWIPHQIKFQDEKIKYNWVVSKSM